MNGKLIRIGNSRGVRIPKVMIEEACLTENVTLRVVDTGILIEPAAAPREGWADAARDLAGSAFDEPVDPPPPVREDRSDWTWG